MTLFCLLGIKHSSLRMLRTQGMTRLPRITYIRDHTPPLTDLRMQRTGWAALINKLASALSA